MGLPVHFSLKCFQRVNCSPDAIKTCKISIDRLRLSMISMGLLLWVRILQDANVLTCYEGYCVERIRLVWSRFPA